MAEAALVADHHRRAGSLSANSGSAPCDRGRADILLNPSARSSAEAKKAEKERKKAADSGEATPADPLPDPD